MLKIEFKKVQAFIQDGFLAECMFILCDEIIFGEPFAMIVYKDNAHTILIENIKKITIFTL